MANHQPKGKVDAGRDYNAGGYSAGTTGGRMTMTPQGGLGAKMVDDLDAVKARYARVKAAERRSDRLYEIELRRQQREAEALAALDDLLDDVRG